MAPNNLVALAAAIREALEAPKSLVPESQAEQDARLNIIDMIPNLNRALVGEVQTLRDMAWVHLNSLSLQVVYHFNIAGLVPRETGISYSELSAKCGLQLVALRRLVRHAMTNKIFYEPSKDHVAHTTTSLILLDDRKTAAWVDLGTDSIKLGAAHTCDALTRWPGSLSPRETGFSIGVGNPGQTSLYEEVKKDPARAVRFRDAMELFSSGDGYEASSLVEGYDWGRLGEGTVVDVGGANGFVSAAIADAYPSLNMIVQDIEMTDAMKSEHQRPKIQFMAHDFFTPQTVKNADVYLFRWVFHNWTDHKNIKILKNTVPALKPGARILINDGCLPEPGTGRWNDERASRNIDLTMMSVLNAREREQDDWQELFDKADPRYKYLGARQLDGSRMWVIEAVWDEDKI